MDHTARLDAYLDRNDLAVVWFARPNSFAWLTGGDNVVDRTGDVGVAAAGYDGDGVTVVTNDIEAPRLRAEELPAGVDVVEFDWHASSLADAVAEASPDPAAADFDVPGMDDVDASALRQPLTDADVDAYRSLGADAAAAVEAVCEDLDPTDTERETAAALRERLTRAGIDSPVVLVGGAVRAPQYRHYTPKEVEVGDYALVSVTAERDGLFASLTRTVTFSPPTWFDERAHATARVASTALAATREEGRRDGTAGDVFAAIQDAYAETGFEGEWRRHHQGGAAGFAGREWIATPNHDAAVHLPMAYAWNPTVEGTKTEDTWLVTEDGFECLTAGDWAREDAAAVGYDVSLAHATPLEK
ncbi:M24 family metallopeptidase [Halospeciosus flavus]|uniref:M24 family metallopeptidase n=1 Tax=Halospeciosus flavus TaxID=3032283 RepID=A0ABD5Z516_9EURY|nr:M24 family metallopeptidase [Halospeciosus flavus]